ncbi:MAG: SLBB domain-containing protein, partial [Motilibacteraceae bacterium]
MSRRSDQLARDVRERLAAVAVQLGGGPPAEREPAGRPAWMEWTGERVEDAGRDGDGGWVPPRPGSAHDLGERDPGPPAEPAPTAGAGLVPGLVPTAGEGREAGLRVGAHRPRGVSAAKGVRKGGRAGHRRRDVPPPRRDPGRRRELGLGRPAVLGLAVVALLAAALAGGLMWRARAVPVEPVAARASAAAGSTPAPLGVRTVSSARAAPSQQTGGTTGSAPASAPASTPLSTSAAGAGTAVPGAAVVVVHVVGQVRRPGLVRLAAGARVDDALRAAGGPTARADLAAVNLARVLVDGEQLRVPAPGEVVPPPPSGAAAGTSAGAGPVGPLDLNAATLAELDALPGVGPVLAQRI